MCACVEVPYAADSGQCGQCDRHVAMQLAWPLRHNQQLLTATRGPQKRETSRSRGRSRRRRRDRSPIQYLSWSLWVINDILIPNHLAKDKRERESEGGRSAGSGSGHSQAVNAFVSRFTQMSLSLALALPASQSHSRPGRARSDSRDTFCRIFVVVVVGGGIKGTIVAAKGNYRLSPCCHPACSVCALSLSHRLQLG